MTNIDWLDNLIAEHPILLKDFIDEVKNLNSNSESGVLDTRKVLELLQKQVVKLEKDAASFRRKEVVAKACKEAVPRRGEGYQAVPLWKLEIENILGHLTSKSVKYERVSDSIAIHRLDKRIVKLVEKKVKNHIVSINKRLSTNLANNSLVLDTVPVKKVHLTAVVALDQEAESIAGYFSIISNGIRKPLYAIFSVSLLCMLFWGGSIFTAASNFFSLHPSYLYICLTIIGLSVYKALVQSKYAKIEKADKEKSKSLIELKKKTLSKITDYITQQLPNEAQILKHNNEITEHLSRQIQEGLREYQASTV